MALDVSRLDSWPCSPLTWCNAFVLTLRSFLTLSACFFVVSSALYNLYAVQIDLDTFCVPLHLQLTSWACISTWCIHSIDALVSDAFKTFLVTLDTIWYECFAARLVWLDSSSFRWVFYLFSLSTHQCASTPCTDSLGSFRCPRCACVLHHWDCLGCLDIPQVFLCACILPISTMTHPLLSITVGSDRFRPVQTSLGIHVQSRTWNQI